MDEQTSGIAFLLVPLIFAVSAYIAIGFHRGKKKNREICLSTFSDLMEVFKPDDQTFTNIGGIVGHHATFNFQENGPIYEIDATITLLPRHAPLYIPVSKLLIRSDRLFITFYMRTSPPGEGHLIEKSYDGIRGHEITNAARLDREEVVWGAHTFSLYYDRVMICAPLKQLMKSHPDPGTIKHIALIPDLKKGFIFMIPGEEAVRRNLEPVFRWMYQVFDSQMIEGGSKP